MLPMLYIAWTELNCESRMKMKAAFSWRYKYGDLYHRRLYFIYTHFTQDSAKSLWSAYWHLNQFLFPSCGSSPFMPTEYCLSLLHNNQNFCINIGTVYFIMWKELILVTNPQRIIINSAFLLSFTKVFSAQ